MKATTKFGYQEVIDTIVDMSKAETKAYGIFKGKFELTKALTWAIGEYATIKEAFDDFGTFEKEIRDLTPAESLEAIGAISSQLSDEQKQSSRIFKAALFAAIGYQNTTAVIEMGKNQLALGADIFSKTKKA